MITAFVSAQKLNIKQPIIAADTIDYLTAKFSFLTSDWRGAIKWAHFRQGTTTYDIKIENDEITAGQHLNLGAGEWEVYLHGTKPGKRITTTVEKITVQPTGVLNGQPLPEIPLTAAEQIDLKAQTALDTANDVKQQAENGDFNGKDGKDGKNGADGFSPIANVTETATGAKISVTDKTGTTEVEVKNGTDGADADISILAPAIRDTLSGTAVATDIVSPLEHDVECKVESKNLISFPYKDGMSKSADGITYSVNPDGSIHVTADENHGALSFSLYEGSALDGTGKNIIVHLSGCPENTGGLSIQPVIDGEYGHYDTGNGSDFTGTVNAILLYVSRNAIGAIDTIFYPQLEKGSAAT